MPVMLTFIREARYNHRTRCACQQGVAVGRRACCEFDADGAAGAAPVVDDELLAEHLGHFGGENTQDGVE
jgi:hypothetical protein